MSTKYVYKFSQHETDGDAKMREVLGGKGAGLAEMCRLGVPVPPGFTISTAACIHALEIGKIDKETRSQVVDHVAWLEKLLDKSFSGEGMPLLLSVRSGARVSMPGMMDTILNLGLNGEAVQRLADLTGNRRFALDSYRRFIQMYSSVVLKLEHDEFERILESVRESEGVSEDSAISPDGLQSLVEQYLDLVVELSGNSFPEDPMEQLWGSIQAVFDSWQNPRAKFYRKIHGIDESWGTAVNVQSMVFGNMGERSGTGVCFSRNPANGVPGIYGEFLINAQGEDVVAGIRTPQAISGADDPESMENRLADSYTQLVDMVARLETHFLDMQDIEFTVENDHLFILQTRSGKRTTRAGLRIAIDLCKEGLIRPKAALMRVDPASMSQLLASEFNKDSKDQALEEGRLMGKGLNAGPGAATGIITFQAEKAVELFEKGETPVLVRAETSPEDIAGMHVSAGILTQRGGMTSHAAVVARGMGKPCVVGFNAMQINYKTGLLTCGKFQLHEGDYISIDGTTGEVIAGRIETQDSSLVAELSAGNFEPGSQTDQFATLMNWVDEHSTMTVRANADTPEDARVARVLGAQGIGLCRTEHMFFGEDRILHMRQMILARDEQAQEKALDNLLPYQMNDFYELFKAMHGLPVTIRLLDPPLHEFLPHTDAQIEDLVRSTGTPRILIEEQIESLREMNPMLGHRGCRLGITRPQIYQMQVSAIAQAVKKARAEGVDAQPEIMIPLIGSQAELDAVKKLITPILVDHMLTDIPVGTMIEIPRAAVTADEVAASADFFSFGTNDLTQCGMGISRDDCGSFLPDYLDLNIIDNDPFKSLDQKGIGKLVEMGVKLGRQTKPDLKTGVCGEHGGDPKSVAFFHAIGLDYVSCSPFRVPVARLAAAQSSLSK